MYCEKFWRFVTRKNAEDLHATDYTDLTDRVLTEGKEAKVFRNQVRSEPCFLRCLLLKRKPVATAQQA